MKCLWFALIITQVGSAGTKRLNRSTMKNYMIFMPYMFYYQDSTRNITSSLALFLPKNQCYAHPHFQNPRKR